MSKNVEKEQRELRIMLKYMVGVHVDTVASQESVSKTTIYNIVKKNNIPLKQDKVVRKQFRDKVFRSLVKEGKSVKDISKELGIPESAVNGYINFEYSKLNKAKKKKEAKGLKLGKGGLSGRVGKDHEEAGLRLSDTKGNIKKRDTVINEGKSIEIGEGSLGGSSDEEDKVKLVMLRELLRYASSVSGLPDYSRDPLLISDYLLPVDLVIMKDISARMVSGEGIEDIARVHRTEVGIVNDVIEKGISRNEFRDKFIRSLVKRGLIRL